MTLLQCPAALSKPLALSQAKDAQTKARVS
jgi:hypothetical protein